MAGEEADRADHGGRTLDCARPCQRRRRRPPPLAERLVAGDKRALARAITLIESDDPAGWELVREVYPRTGKARIVGFTGPPGVGKSTLIGALTAELRKAEREVAVLSIDPSSPFTRGALLGDRIRLSDHFLDPGVFIRSMASRGALGGLSEAALQVALVMDAAGKDDVLIETVGVGQAEIDIVDHADTIVLALMPGSGDSIQALKAGVMEIPDVIVVNKADHPMTDTMVREVRGVLALSHDPEGWKVPILRTEAARGEGVEELAAADRRAPRLHRGGGHAGRAPRPQPAQRGARHRHLADAPPARGDRRRGPAHRRAAGAGGAARARPGQRRRRAAGEAGRWLRRRRCPRCGGDAAGSAPSWTTSTARAVGEVQGFFVDAESGEPAWLIARLGRRRSARLVAVPLRDCAGAAFGVWVAHDGEALAQRPGRRPDPAAAARARADDLRALRDRRAASAAPPRSRAAPRARHRRSPA